MVKVAKCPICGDAPTMLDYYGENYEKSYSCCGVEIHGRELWNKYAAAFNLASAWNEKKEADKAEMFLGRITEERVEMFKNLNSKIDESLAEVFQAFTPVLPGDNGYGVVTEHDLT